MASFQNYIFPESLEDAYELLQANRRNAVIGGNGWLALGRQKLHTAIDLSRLGLGQIRVGPAYVEIGAMATLRQLERELPGSLLACCVKPIAGVQFRNLATVGGSLYSRFGFSDPVTALMAMDTTVLLHRQGDVPIADFVWQKPSRDIVLGCRVENNGRRAAYQSLRLSATDLPVLTVAVSRLGSDWRVVVGARPGKATLAEEASRLLSEGKADAGTAASAAAEELSFGSNMRGSGSYRRQIAQVLIARAIEQLHGEGGLAIC